MLVGRALPRPRPRPARSRPGMKLASGPAGARRARDLRDPRRAAGQRRVGRAGRARGRPRRLPRSPAPRAPRGRAPACSPSSASRRRLVAVRGPRRRAVRVLRGQGPRRAGRRSAAPRCWRSPPRCCRCSTARELTTEEWLALGLGARAGRRRRARASALLALAREIGELRLAIGPQGALEIAERGPGDRRAHRAGPALRRHRRRRLRARGLHLRGLPHLPRARAGDRRVRARPARACCAASTSTRTPTRGRWPTCPAARSRSRSAPTAPCSPRAPSTPARSSRRVLAAAERRRGAINA